MDSINLKLYRYNLIILTLTVAIIGQINAMNKVGIQNQPKQQLQSMLSINDNLNNSNCYLPDLPAQMTIIYNHISNNGKRLLEEEKIESLKDNENYMIDDDDQVYGEISSNCQNIIIPEDLDYNQKENKIQYSGQSENEFNANNNKLMFTLNKRDLSSRSIFINKDGNFCFTDIKDKEIFIKYLPAYNSEFISTFNSCLKQKLEYLIENLKNNKPPYFKLTKEKLIILDGIIAKKYLLEKIKLSEYKESVMQKFLPAKSIFIIDNGNIFCTEDDDVDFFKEYRSNYNPESNCILSYNTRDIVENYIEALKNMFPPYFKLTERKLLHFFRILNGEISQERLSRFIAEENEKNSTSNYQLTGQIDDIDLLFQEKSN